MHTSICCGEEFLCCAAGGSQLAIDLGGLVDAIHVDSTGVLGLRNIVTRNAGPKGAQRLGAGARYKAQYFGAWPSITLDPGARVGPLLRDARTLSPCGRRLVLWLAEKAPVLACLSQEHPVMLGPLTLHTAVYSVQGRGGLPERGTPSVAVGVLHWAQGCCAGSHAWLQAQITRELLCRRLSPCAHVLLQVVMQNCSLYMNSERAWQQCALFQNSSAALLKRTGYQGNFSSTGQSCFRVYDTWAFHSSITDLVTNETGTPC